MSLNTILATAPLTATGYHLKATGTALGQSLIWDNGTNVGIGNTNTSYTLDVSGTVRGTTSAYFATTSGSVGIAATDPVKTLDVRGTLAISNSSSSYWYMDRDDSDGRFKILTDGNSEKFTILTGGNVGIGATDPAKKLDVYSTATTNTAQLVVSDASSTNRLYLGTFSNGSYISFGGTYQSGWSANGTNAIANIGMSATSGASTIQFETSSTNGAGPTERMRITSGGFLKASNNGTYHSLAGTFHEFNNSNGGNVTLVVKNTGSTNGSGIICISPSADTSEYFLSGSSGGSTKAVIYTDGNIKIAVGATYGVLSDAKLKTNIVDVTSKLDDILKLKVRNFGSLENPNEKYIGFIAQEFEQVFPSLVTISEDTIINENGDKENTGEMTMGIKESALIPILVKAIQEQQAQIEELKAEIDELKNK